ncbi:MAG: SPOR domain-containing protein [Prevotella sp.]|nr:SPOR domain-containing protein [Prevotella sp.]
MIELERHIEILLLSNDCVIVPDLGGFMAHHVDARYDQTDGMFVPPLRTLGFNPQLTMNDSLLVQSYIEAYDISYPEALRRIEGEVAELKAHLENDRQYRLNDIGLLILNDEGKLEFEPCEAGILTPALYGLGTVEMKPLDDAVPQAVTNTTDMPDEGSITIKMSWLRNVVAVAAAIVAFLMIGSPVHNSNEMTDVQQSAFINVSATHHRPATPTADTPSPALEEEDDLQAVQQLPAPATEAPQPNTFCIVMASQVSENNAHLFISQMADKGYDGARILVSGNKNIRRVVYGNFATEAEAAEQLRELRSQTSLFRNTWIMEMK